MRSPLALWSALAGVACAAADGAPTYVRFLAVGFFLVSFGLEFAAARPGE